MICLARPGARSLKSVVADQVLLRDTDLPVDSRESCQLDSVRPICGDATIVAPLYRDGTPWAEAPDRDGASFARAIQARERVYPELAI